MGVLWFPNQSVSCLIGRFFLFQFVKYKGQYRGHNGQSGPSCGMNTTLMPLKKPHSNRLWETLYQDRIELGKNSVSEILTSITGPGLAFTQLLCGLEKASPLGDLREVDSTFVQTKRPPFLQQVQPQARAHNMTRGAGNECQLPLVTFIEAFEKYTNSKQYIAALQRVGKLIHVSKGSLVVQEVPILYGLLCMV